MAQIIRLSEHRRRRNRIYFTRSELSQLLSLYSDRVASGEWRDYAIDHGTEMAVFSVFRHSYDRPLYAIAKMPAPRGAAYAVVDQNGKLVRAPSLADALSTFERRLRLVKTD